MNTWQQLLFGAAPALYNVQPSQWVGQQTAPTETGVTTPTTTGTTTGEGGGNGGPDWRGTGQESPYGGTRSTPKVSDPQYWGGNFTPDLGWKDVMKAYGPAIAGGLMSGPGAAISFMARNYMNPTKDPTFQKTAQQYLDQYAPATSLSSLVQQINDMYKTNPMSKTFATDTARGVLMGAGDFANQYGQSMQQGLMPHQFAQAVTGMNMAGLDPYNMGNWSTAGTSPYSIARYAGDISQGRFAPDGAVAQSLQRREANTAARKSSRDWMEAVLDGRTTQGYNEWSGWSQSDRNGGSRDSSRGDPGNNTGGGDTAAGHGAHDNAERDKNGPNR